MAWHSQSRGKSSFLDVMKRPYQYPNPIIDDLENIEPALRDINLDPGRPGVDRVFHAFFDSGKRVDDHFAGGDKGNDFGRKLLDAPRRSIVLASVFLFRLCLTHCWLLSIIL